jgi:hypothetical protein
MRTTRFALLALLAGCGEVKSLALDASGSDGPGSDGAGDDAPPSGTCDDAFADAAIDATIWKLADVDNTPVVITETANRLRITIPAHSGGTSLGSNTLVSAKAFAFADLDVRLEPFAIPADPETQIFFFVVDGTKQVGFSMYGNTHLHASINGQGMTVPFSPTADRFWRIHQGNGGVSLETSPDRAAWTVRHSGVVAMTAPEIRIGAQLDVGAGGVFEVEGIEMLVAGGASCPLR